MFNQLANVAHRSKSVIIFLCGCVSPVTDRPKRKDAYFPQVKTQPQTVQYRLFRRSLLGHRYYFGFGDSNRNTVLLRWFFALIGGLLFVSVDEESIHTSERNIRKAWYENDLAAVLWCYTSGGMLKRLVFGSMEGKQVHIDGCLFGGHFFKEAF